MGKNTSFRYVLRMKRYFRKVHVLEEFQIQRVDGPKSRKFNSKTIRKNPRKSKILAIFRKYTTSVA